MKKAVVVLLCLVILLLGLPMAGVYLFGTPFDRYLEFPPKSQFVSHAPFSWTAFLIYLSIISFINIEYMNRYDTVLYGYYLKLCFNTFKSFYRLV